MKYSIIIQSCGYIFIVILVSLGIVSHADAQSQYALYLPIINFSDPVHASASCEPSPEEREFATLMIEHPEQQHPSLSCNAILASVARHHAADMANRGYFGHVNPDGYGPNYLVRQAGYVLPASYGQELTSNNIEIIGAGPANAAIMWDAFLGVTHRTFLLGATSFFAEQSEYGIGYINAPGSPYHYYWVIIIAKPGA